MTETAELMNLTLTAHAVAAQNNETNVSSMAVKQAAYVGKDFQTAMAAGILTLGNIHAPVTQARHLIFATDNEGIKQALEEGMRLPGYGNAFHKDEIDPAWEGVDEFLRSHWSQVHDRIHEIAGLIEEVKEKKLFPNAAAYTAATAQIMNTPWGAEVGLVVAGRLPVWSEQWREAMDTLT